MNKLTAFYSPTEAAEFLRISLDRLTSILRVEKIAFTDLSEKGDAVPWETDAASWGLTGEQLAKLVATRARQSSGAAPEATGQQAVLTKAVPPQTTPPAAVATTVVNPPPATVSPSAISGDPETVGRQLLVLFEGAALCKLIDVLVAGLNYVPVFPMPGQEGRALMATGPPDSNGPPEPRKPQFVALTSKIDLKTHHTTFDRDAALYLSIQVHIDNIRAIVHKYRAPSRKSKRSPIEVKPVPSPGPAEQKLMNLGHFPSPAHWRRCYQCDGTGIECGKWLTRDRQGGCCPRCRGFGYLVTH